MERIDSLVQPYIDDRSILGAAVAILKGGEAAYLGGFGETSVEASGGKVTPHTLFALGSIGKTICAALIMRLVEEGLLNLDSPVLEYLPSLKFSNPEYGWKITLRHILSHTTGLPAAGKDWGPRDPDSLRRFVYEQIPHYSFLAEPGAVHLYSSTVFCIAGHISETVTGRYYDNLVQEYVFDPLEMVSATYDPAAALTYPVALPHKTDPGGGLRVAHKVPYNVSGNPSGFAYGSVIDLANLARMFLNGGRFAGQQFLAPASIAEMHTQQASRYIDASAHPLAHLNRGYGLGFYTGEYQGRRAARHGGVSQSFNCFFDLFPDDATGVVLLTNYSREEALMELFSALVHQALGIPDKGIVFLAKPASQAPAVDDSLLQPCCGAYLNVESGDLVNISLINGGLRIEWEGKSMPLVGYGGGQYYAEVSEKYRLPVAFVENAQGKVVCVTVSGMPYFPFQSDLSIQPDLQVLKSYQGIYKDPSNSSPDELFFVDVQDGELYITEGDHRAPAKAASIRSFLSELGFIEFEDTAQFDMKVLIRGKSTRCYPLDAEEYRQNQVIKYLVDLPDDH